MLPAQCGCITDGAPFRVLPTLSHWEPAFHRTDDSTTTSTPFAFIAGHGYDVRNVAVSSDKPKSASAGGLFPSER